VTDLSGAPNTEFPEETHETRPACKRQKRAFGPSTAMHKYTTRRLPIWRQSGLPTVRRTLDNRTPTRLILYCSRQRRNAVLGSNNWPFRFVPSIAWRANRKGVEDGEYQKRPDDVTDRALEPRATLTPQHLFPVAARKTDPILDSLTVNTEDGYELIEL
jgi:hypothetical protein